VSNTSTQRKKFHEEKNIPGFQKNPVKTPADTGNVPPWILEAFPRNRETEELPAETVALILYLILRDHSESEIVCQINGPNESDPQFGKEIRGCIHRTCKWLGLPENLCLLTPEARYKALHRWSNLNIKPKTAQEYHEWEPLEADYTGLVP
jgi:hypothetical protein